jgi:DNA end-binding protein Ku
VPQRESRERRRTRLGLPREAAAGDDERPVGRPVWSGSLTFGLVTVPVELYSAQRGGGVAMRMLGPDGSPLARQYVCPKEEKPLERDEIVRGYEVQKGRFVVVSDEELEALAPRSSRDIELQQFVDRDEIDPVYFVRTYFLVPRGQTKAYRLLAEIMEETNRAGIAHFVMRERAYAIAIFAEDGILRAETLRFADELRSPDQLGLPKRAKSDSARVRAVKKAVSALARPELSVRELRDDTPAALLALARKKRARGEDVVEAPAEGAQAEDGEGAEVIDLVALLKERLGEQKSRRKTSGSARRTSGARRKRR